MHSILPFLLAMVAVIIILEMWATKLKIAYPILLVVGGLAISFIPGLPQVKIKPDMIFFIFLPPLLFEAAWSISFKEMKKWWRIIGSFAFLVVFFTALSVAVFANHFIPGFTLALGFLLGGIVSPPDAVSTGAITKFVKIPKSTSTILQGESLLNDASSLIIFRFALIAIGTGQFIWQEASLSFLWMIFGGTGIGLILGWVFIQIHKRLPTDAATDVILTIIEPYCMYWIAEQMDSSGVLAVVAGGLLLSTKRLSFLNSSSRIKGFSVWESFVFILNGIVFLIIGLELPEIVNGLHEKGIPLSTAIGYGVLVTIVIIGARMLSSYAALVSTLIFRRSVMPTRDLKRFLTLPLLLGWTGMRGVVSLASALAIPITLNGVDFPYRNLILFITFVVILLTLVVQGLTLPYIISRSKLFDSAAENALEPDEITIKKIKIGLREHTYQFLKTKYENGSHNHSGMQKLMQHWEEKTKSNDDDWMNEKTKAIFIEMLVEQRSYLAELNKDPQINEDLIFNQLYQIDLEEERMKMI